MNIEELFEKISDTNETKFEESESNNQVVNSLEKKDETKFGESESNKHHVIKCILLLNSMKQFIKVNPDKFEIIDPSRKKVSQHSIIVIYPISDTENDIVLLRNIDKIFILDIPIKHIKFYQSGIQIYQELDDKKYVTFINRLGTGKPETFVTKQNIPISSFKIVEGEISINFDFKLDKLKVISKETINLYYPPYKKIQKDKNDLTIQEVIEDLISISDSINDIHHLLKIYRVCLKIIGR